MLRERGGGGRDQGVGRGGAIFPGYIPGSIPGRHRQQQQLTQYRHHGGRSPSNASFIPSLDFATSPKAIVASVSTCQRNQQIEQRQQRSPLHTQSFQSMTLAHTVSLLSA